MTKIDVTFDFRSDSGGKDPDSASPRLREYHRLLWSKKLPSGPVLSLEDGPGPLLTASTSLGYSRFSSDTITNSLGSHRATQRVMIKSHEHLMEETRDIGSTIGARIIFHGDQVAGLRTINVLRGFHPLIRDRFDLTLECIKRHYEQETSPLSEVLCRYSDFFKLFEDFQGYVDFFLLSDWVSDSGIRLLTADGKGLGANPYPQSSREYETYLKRTIECVILRNERIRAWASAQDC
jgi:hypothetical protein